MWSTLQQQPPDRMISAVGDEKYIAVAGQTEPNRVVKCRLARSRYPPLQFAPRAINVSWLTGDPSEGKNFPTCGEDADGVTMAIAVASTTDETCTVGSVGHSCWAAKRGHHYLVLRRLHEPNKLIHIRGDRTPCDMQGAVQHHAARCRALLCKRTSFDGSWGASHCNPSVSGVANWSKRSASHRCTMFPAFPTALSVPSVSPAVPVPASVLTSVVTKSIDLRRWFQLSQTVSIPVLAAIHTPRLRTHDGNGPSWLCWLLCPCTVDC